jgi:hypothetical protein
VRAAEPGTVAAGSGEHKAETGETKAESGEIPGEGRDKTHAYRDLITEQLRTAFALRHPGLEFVLQNPDLRIDFDMSRWEFLPPIRAPVFLYGRYRKLVRDIPQSRWRCTVCREDKQTNSVKAKRLHSTSTQPEDVSVPKGDVPKATCESCQGTGLQYADSVQDLVGKKIVDAFSAADCVMHGMGREDVDVRCLGQGRPFVLELKEPLRRRPSDSLEALAKEVCASASGKVELVSDTLRYSSRAEAVRLKGAEAEKSYTVRAVYVTARGRQCVTFMSHRYAWRSVQQVVCDLPCEYLHHGSFLGFKSFSWGFRVLEMSPIEHFECRLEH